MLAQLNDISAFPFKCNFTKLQIYYPWRDVILETPWYELYIYAITTQYVSVAIDRK